MKMRLFILMFIQLLYFPIISFGEIKDENVKVVDIEGSIGKKIPSKSLDMYFNPSVLQIETSDEYLIGDYFIAGSKNGKLALVSNQDIFIIDSNSGKIESKISRRGNGPQEYVEISSVSLDPYKDIIYVTDMAKNRVMTYDYYGTFISELPFKSVADLRKLNDNNYVVCYFLRNAETSCFGIYDKDFKLIRNSTVKKRLVKNFMISVDVTLDSNGECCFQEYYSDTLYKVTSDADIPYLKIDLGKYEMPMKYYATTSVYNKYSDDYIISQSKLIVDNFFFYKYFYDRKMYLDVWNIEKGYLISRTTLRGNKDSYGFKISVDGVEVHCWPEYASDGIIYCTVLPNEAEKISKDYSVENNPMLIKLTMKSK